MTPFELFAQDTDEVIMLINYFVDKSDDSNVQNQSKTKSGEKRIKVNDKTATGGWY